MASSGIGRAASMFACPNASMYTSRSFRTTAATTPAMCPASMWAWRASVTRASRSEESPTDSGLAAGKSCPKAGALEARRPRPRPRMKPSAILSRRAGTQSGPVMGSGMAARWVRVALPHKRRVSPGRSPLGDRPSALPTRDATVSYVALGGESSPEVSMKPAGAPMPHVLRRHPVRLDHRRLQLISP